MTFYFTSFDIKFLLNGKPYLENGPYFNYSHSGEYVAFSSHSSRPVGVDIERIDESKLRAIKYVVKEKGTTEELFQMWSNKESLIKCKSTGIQDIKKAPALPLSGVREFDGKRYYTKSMIYNGYSLSITLEGDEPFEIEIVSEIL